MVCIDWVGWFKCVYLQRNTTYAPTFSQSVLIFQHVSSNSRNPERIFSPAPLFVLWNLSPLLKLVSSPQNPFPTLSCYKYALKRIHLWSQTIDRSSISYLSFKKIEDRNVFFRFLQHVFFCFFFDLLKEVWRIVSFFVDKFHSDRRSIWLVIPCASVVRN